jgi:hypothetical protein
VLLERKIIKKYAFTLLVETGFFDDFDDEQTEALIPHWLSPEQQQELIDRYEKMGVPYVVQSDPMDQPDPGDVMDPPRSRRQIVSDVMTTADQIVKDQQEMQAQRHSITDTFNADPLEKTMPLSRISNMSKAEDTFPTGMISDYDEYSDPKGQDAKIDMLLGGAPDDDGDEEQTFNFDSFVQDEEKRSKEQSMPYIDLDGNESDLDSIREASLSRGALIRRKYYGRY